MTKILTYKMFESMDNEYDVITNIIIPFILKKYEDLSVWANKKNYKFAAPISRLFFEKKNDEWEIIIEASGWSGNESNRIIKNILHNNIANKCNENGIKLKNINYAGMTSIDNTENKYLIYKVQEKTIIKNEKDNLLG